MHQLPAVELVMRDWLASSIAAYKIEPAVADIEADCFDVHDDLLRMG
jgi:hypothetical protein